MLEHIEPAVRKAKARDLGGKTLHDVCEEEHAHFTVHDCFRRSELLRRYASVGKFRMAAARYHLQSGEVEWLPNRPLPKEPEREAPHVVHGAPTGTPPHVALRLLQAGHRRFLGDGKPTADLTAERRERLSHGQQPLAIVLTCADSRVAPEHVFDAGLGELFVIRIAGNTLNDDALASIEYAAGHLGASLLVVMGHSKCGAVLAASQQPEGHELSPNLRALLLRIEPSVAAARAQAKGRDLVDLAVRANAQRAVTEARSRSAVLRELEHAGRFTMLGCVYDIASGDLEWLKDGAATAAAHAGSADRGAHGPAAAPVAGHDHAAPTRAAASPGAKHELAAHELPVLDWAAGHAAPAGETMAKPSGHAPATAPAAHGAEDAHAAGSDEAHGSAPHGGHAAPTAPVNDAHGDPAGHAAPHGEGADSHDAAHGQHAAPGAASGHDDHGDHAGHGDHGAAAHAGTEAPAAPWRDPIVLVGISGVVSLLAAAVLAMKRR